MTKSNGIKTGFKYFIFSLEYLLPRAQLFKIQFSMLFLKTNYNKYHYKKSLHHHHIILPTNYYRFDCLLNYPLNG